MGVSEPTRATMQRHYPAYRLRASVVASLGNALAYGEVNNRTIQRLFDVDVYQARDIIRDLVVRGC
ncbi:MULTISPECIES: hypothetical protein [unclassified Nonomuraea]|uniref:hypothetical protein n=1 Tax=unclassified Nonomuraea TaxID=2593643 RepID=UPI00191BD096|nr:MULTISPECIES: hypothetical protein [unclassified Nonomuraea]